MTHWGWHDTDDEYTDTDSDTPTDRLSDSDTEVIIIDTDSEDVPSFEEEESQRGSEGASTQANASTEVRPGTDVQRLPASNVQQGRVEVHGCIRECGYQHCPNYHSAQRSSTRQFCQPTCWEQSDH